LRDLGLAKLFFWPVKAKLRKLVAQGMVGFLERLSRHWIFVGEFFAHSDNL